MTSPIQPSKRSIQRTPMELIDRESTTCQMIPVALLAACTVGLLVANVMAKEPSARPHIVLIMVDDLGKEWVGAYGATGIETPRIDELANNGVMFHNFYCMPQCTPTRLTLLTGQYPFRHGWVNHWDVPRWGGGCSFDPSRNPSLPRTLREAGYATAAAGKWQIDDFRQEPNAMHDAGFDEWCMWTGYEAGHPPSGERYWHPYIYCSNVGQSGPSSRSYAGEFGPDVFADFLIDFMQRRHEDGPMFVYFPMVLTHGPLVSTPSEPTANGKMARHRAMVRYTDRLLGRIVDTVDRLGIREETLILWTTDNGTSRGIRGQLDGRAVDGGKSETTEAGVCVPLIASWPGTIAPGRSSKALVDMTDMMPSLAELAGITLPSEPVSDGQSFVSVLRDASAESQRQWIMAMGGRNEAKLSDRAVENKFWFRDRVLRDQRYKLYFASDRSITKFVDLRRDPEEDVDLQDSPNEEVQASLRLLLAAANSCPERDNDPIYAPLPTQPWYRRPSVTSQVWKEGYPGAR